MARTKKRFFKPCKSHQYRDPVTNRCRKKSTSAKKSRAKKSSAKKAKSLKPCKSHQYRDPVTNRCRNKSTSAKKSSTKKSSAKKAKSLKPCKSHQYRDPVTNRCRNKSTSAKKSSTKKSSAKKAKSLKPCKSHQYRDPVTNRCRNKSTSAKKSSSKKSSAKKLSVEKSSSKKSSNESSLTETTVLEYLPDYYIEKLFGTDCKKNSECVSGCCDTEGKRASFKCDTDNCKGGGKKSIGGIIKMPIERNIKYRKIDYKKLKRGKTDIPLSELNKNIIKIYRVPNIIKPQKEVDLNKIDSIYQQSIITFETVDEIFKDDPDNIIVIGRKAYILDEIIPAWIAGFSLFDCQSRRVKPQYPKDLVGNFVKPNEIHIVLATALKKPELKKMIEISPLQIFFDYKLTIDLYNTAIRLRNIESYYSKQKTIDEETWNRRDLLAGMLINELYLKYNSLVVMNSKGYRIYTDIISDKNGYQVFLSCFLTRMFVKKHTLLRFENSLRWVTLEYLLSLSKKDLLEYIEGSTIKQFITPTSTKKEIKTVLESYTCPYNIEGDEIAVDLANNMCRTCVHREII